MKLLLDTTVLIDALRASKRRRQFLSEAVRAGHVLATTTLNIAELYAGMRSGEEIQTEAFLQGLECLEVTGPTARLGGKLKNTWAKKGRTLALVDTIVAATAIEHRCMLATDNRIDFPMSEVQLYPLP
jgi:predicted nucleic acid-binding protein